MADIRELGGSGRAVFETAQRLQGAGLIDDAQFKELTNGNVGPQDVKIANTALEKLKADTPDAMGILRAIPKLNNDILGLQARGLGKTLTGGAPSESAPTAKPGERPRSFLDSIGAALGEGLQKLQPLLDGSYAREAVRNLK